MSVCPLVSGCSISHKLLPLHPSMEADGPHKKLKKYFTTKLSQLTETILEISSETIDGAS